MMSSCRGTAETNPTGIHEVAGSIPGLTQRVKDLVLLWLWCRLATVAPIRPLAREPPYATGTALERAKRQKKKKGSGVTVTCGVGCRHGSDPVLLWLWCRLATIAPI